tara:strand:+ start:268 stop:588 length:321 start_codon:yes stop_codon:yes gene_type:complete
MSQTLKAGEHKLLFTQQVNKQIAEDSKFAKFVWESLIRFNQGDWGNVSEESSEQNDADLESLNNGGWYGRILAVYQTPDTDRIWIIRNTAEEDGTQAVTVLFPSEY